MLAELRKELRKCQKGGRPTYSEELIQRVLKYWESKDITGLALAKKLNISSPTLYRWRNEVGVEVEPELEVEVDPDYYDEPEEVEEEEKVEEETCEDDSGEGILELLTNFERKYYVGDMISTSDLLRVLPHLKVSHETLLGLGSKFSLTRNVLGEMIISVEGWLKNRDDYRACTTTPPVLILS